MDLAQFDAGYSQPPPSILVTEATPPVGGAEGPFPPPRLGAGCSDVSEGLEAGGGRGGALLR